MLITLLSSTPPATERIVPDYGIPLPSRRYQWIDLDHANDWSNLKGTNVKNHREMDHWVNAKERTPKTGALVRYRTKNHSCVGHHDRWGEWIDTNGQAERGVVVQWREP